MITDEMVERAIEAQSLFKINFDLKRELWVVFDTRTEPKSVFETTSRREAEDKVLFLGQRAALEAALAGAWRPIESAPSTQNVLAFYRNELGVGRIVKAVRCEQFEREYDHDHDELIADYSDERDAYFWPAGWYEVIENWDDYTHVSMPQPTHWMPIPPPPVKEG